MAWISEIHYQNGYAGSSGVAEFVEISLSAADHARASDFEFATYQIDGTTGVSVNLGTLTPVFNTDNGHYIYTINAPVTSPNHSPSGTGSGEAEAVALVDTAATPSLISFYDIGGGVQNITATTGPAAGETSTNIAASVGGTSIQFTRNGVRVDDTIDSNNSTICFAKGTLIETDKGIIPIEDLSKGAQVKTQDGTFATIKWIGGRAVSSKNLIRNAKLYPIRISAGALGNGLPKRDLCVSGQHRILISSKIAQRIFNSNEVLIAANKLTALPGIYVDTSVTEVTYFHFLFDTHEIVFAEGVPSESLFTGPEALKAVTPAAKEEILSLFPMLEQKEYAEPACTIPIGKMQKKLVERHVKNPHVNLMDFAA